jgi:ectoine hydroxylase-related dioxygenase (phytanoyl-CoA dioxygenase family)
MAEIDHGPAAFKASPEEKSKQKYSTSTLQQILAQMHEDGLVVLEDVVDVAHVDAINEYMQKETDRLLEAPDSYFNHGVRSNILHCAPLKPGYIFEDIYMNPFVIQVMNAYLGARPRWNFITGNNALSHTDDMRQPVHKDIRWPNHVTGPFYVIANVPLSDFSPANGSTEFWLGSHRATTSDDQSYDKDGNITCNVKEERLEQRRSQRPPIQIHMKKGSISLRDLRLWHCGMPNPSDEHRIMLATGYQARWYPNYTQRLKVRLTPLYVTHYLIHRHSNNSRL